MRSKNALYCFSPPVMLATFIIEIGLLAYVIVRYKMTPVVRAASAMLLFLAVFQLAEYNVCSGDGALTGQWSRIGFVAITFLPVLGLHLVQLIARRPNRKLTLVAYATAAVWAVVFGTSDWAFAEQVCGGNYIMFHLRDNIDLFYSVYYYAWLLAGLALIVRFWRTRSKQIRLSLRWLAAGYLIFLLPTATVSLLFPETTAGIPSIMCGFAVIFAVILTAAILPHAVRKQDRRTTHQT